MRSSLRFTSLVGLLLLFGLRADAVSTNVTHIDLPTCDVLSVPGTVDEIGGVGGIVLPSQPFGTVFPVGEQIRTGAFGSAGSPSVCPSALDSSLIPNQRVGIINLQPWAYTDLWYVADLNTTISNVDGGVAGAGGPLVAFKIDAVGLNTPLIAESILADGIFAPGEMWTFVLQDWSNNLIPAPHYFNCVGVAKQCLGNPGNATTPPTQGSTGSIIGIPVPEPGTFVLVLAGLVGIASRRKARA